MDNKTPEKDSKAKANKKAKKNRHILYRIIRVFVNLYVKVVFKRKFLRNEIKGKKGPFVIIANHQCQLDFANLVGATREIMTFVISDSFANTGIAHSFIGMMNVIPKKQFETAVSDMKKMKRVIANDGILVLYPAGLMCADGISTPIPEATYKFIKWLDADVYVARTYGSYLVMPKWAKKKRHGRTLLDIYKFLDREQLRELTDEQMKEKTDFALSFDAYAEQDKMKISYKNCDNLEGLQNVLYICPHCGKEFSIEIRDKNVIYCTECGYAEQSDKYGILHKISTCGEEIAYVSDWSRMIRERERNAVASPNFSINTRCKIRMLNREQHEFIECGEGVFRIAEDKVMLSGNVNGAPLDISASVASFPSLPFKPGEYVEIQINNESYRLYLEHGRECTKYLNTVEILHILHMNSIKG